MDIDILLALQGVREAMPLFDRFMATFSDIVTQPFLVAVPAVLYWVVSKRDGLMVAFAAALGTFINNLVKATACIYRPWVRSSAVHPSEYALKKATGYSFPSGHTVMATTLFGGMGWVARKSRAWLTALLWLLVAGVMFSRIFLGVHTPQDVLVGLLVGIVGIVLSSRFVDLTEGTRKYDTTILVGGLIAVAAATAFVMLKSYPMDYVEGELIMDPTSMRVDALKGHGMMAGFLVGWYLERRLVNFKVEGTVKQRVLRSVVGLVVIGVSLGLGTLLGGMFPLEEASKFFEYFVLALGALFLAPLAFTKLVPVSPAA